MLGAVGVLPAFTQRETEIADEFLVKGDRYVEAVASGPVLGTLLGIAHIGIAVDHLVVSGIEVCLTHIVVIEQRITCRELEPLDGGGLIVETQACAPAVDGLGVIASAEFALETDVHDLGEFLLSLKGEVESEIVRLGHGCQRQRHHHDY